MENQKINVTVENGVKELVIRHGNAEPVVELRKSVSVIGNLNVPLNYLQNPPKWFAANLEGDSPLEYSFLKVNREQGEIALFVDAGTQWESSYTGSLKLDESFRKFKINTGNSYSTFELSDLIKMHRSFFETKDVAMRLVSELRNFKAKVDKDLENVDDARGNKRVLIAQIVDSNIPESFKLNVPIFKGYEKQIIDVEININAQDFSCTLISPEANDIVNETKNELIDKQLAEIKALFPALKIFEI